MDCFSWSFVSLKGLLCLAAFSGQGQGGRGRLKVHDDSDFIVSPCELIALRRINPGNRSKSNLLVELNTEQCEE